MGGLRAGRVDRTLDDLDVSLAAVVAEDLLARPQRLPAGVVHLAAQTRGLGVLVEAQAHHRVQIVLQGDEAVQRGPQPVAADRQDQGFQLLLRALDLIDHGAVLAPTDRGDVVLAGQGRRLGRILGRLQRVEGLGLAVLDEAAAVQVHQTRLDPLAEDALHFLRAGFRLDQAGDDEDVALLVEQAVGELHGLEHHGRAGHDHRAHQAHDEGHQQCPADGFLLFRHGAWPSA